MQPKNLLIIMSDQHNRRMLGCYGHDIVTTPNLDRLAARGTLFTDAYTPCPVCVPARASFATGKYVHQIGNWDNAIAYDGTAPSWHHQLREMGHHVVSIGKLHFRSKEDLILAVLRLRDEQFRNWLFRRMEQAGPPRAQLFAMFDALGEWFGSPDFRSCMFIKASSEYPDPAHPIHAQSAEHKRLLFTQVEKLAAQAGAKDPAQLARGLLLLKEGAIVTAHLGHEADPAGDAKMVAGTLMADLPA